MLPRYVRDLIREDEKSKAQEKLEAVLMEGIRSSKPTEMTGQDWADIRREAVEQFEARCQSHLLKGTRSLSVFEITQDADGGFCAECLTESIFAQGDIWGT